jgi:hypothetical protein
MVRGRGRKSLYIGGIAALLTHFSMASAQPPGAQAASDSKKACLAQHEAAQTLRRTGKLLEARDAILVCSREDCPAVVRADCGEWLDVVRKTVPSLVMRVKSDDKDVFDVRVSVDGKLLTSHLDGTPFELNPGPHVVRFEHSNFAPIEQQILVLEGEKNRVVDANFVKVGSVPTEPLQRPIPAEPLTPVETYRPTPVLTYVLGGVALAGFAGFAALAVTGQDKKKALESSCRPICTDNDLQPVRTQFLLADVSLGIAIVSTVAAGVVYLTRPAKSLPSSSSQGKLERPASPIAFGFSPTASGAQFAMQTEF